MQLNILQRLNLIKEEIGYVQKDKKVDTYMAVTHDAVTAHTRGLFVKHGVMVFPTELKSAVVDSTMKTGKGNPIIRFEATYRVAFVSVDDPASAVSVDVTAHALDQGDKAPGKALSYATKYAVLKVLQLETGEEEESRITTQATVDVEGHRAKIVAAKTMDALAKVWSDIATDCEAAGDKDAYKALKDEVKTRKVALTPKKEEGK